MKYFLCLLLVLPLTGYAEIYKWTDAKGNVHFGDSPRKQDDAQKVVLRINSYEHVEFEDMEFYQGSSSSRVTMYSTSWCGYCKKARRYFEANNIGFVEYDIEEDAAAKREYDKLGGRGVPVILVGQKKMNGFSVAGFERIYP